jgi:hypothetical protein
MDMIAKLPTVASIIYRNLYREGTAVQAIDNSFEDAKGVIRIPKSTDNTIAKEKGQKDKQ